jgi:hypothetical protein
MIFGTRHTVRTKMTGFTNGDMLPQHRLDLSMRAILVGEYDKTPTQATVFSERIWKRFLVQIVNVCDPPHVSLLNELELGRWSESSLGHQKSQNPIGRNSHDFLISVTRVSRIYTTNSVSS